MKALLLAAAFLTAAPALSAGTRTYQVTGPVLEVKEDAVVVQKGKEKWEIAKGADTKVTGELKPGTQVTIQYRMSAASISAKEGKPDNSPSADKAPAKAKSKK